MSTHGWLPRLALEGSHLAEEEILPASYHYFLPAGQYEENVSRVQETRLFHVGEVNNTIARRAKERGAIEPPRAIPKQSPDERRAVGQMDACMVAASFKKKNVRRSDQPTLAVVAQEDEVIQTKCAIVLFHSGVCQSVRLDGIEDSTFRCGGLCLRQSVTICRDVLSRSTTAGSVQFHERSWTKAVWWR